MGGYLYIRSEFDQEIKCSQDDIPRPYSLATQMHDVEIHGFLDTQICKKNEALIRSENHAVPFVLDLDQLLPPPQRFFRCRHGSAAAAVAITGGDGYIKHELRPRSRRSSDACMASSVRGSSHHGAGGGILLHGVVVVGVDMAEWNAGAGAGAKLRRRRPGRLLASPPFASLPSVLLLPAALVPSTMVVAVLAGVDDLPLRLRRRTMEKKKICQLSSIDWIKKKNYE
jgi:hypothetical protein